MKTALPIALTCLATPALAEDVIMPHDEIPFVEEAPGLPMMLGMLWGERAEGAAGTYLKVPGGFEAPLHSHTADYRAVVIKGTWSHWVPAEGQTNGVPLPAGSYWTQVKDQPHKDRCLSEVECVILLINDDPYVTELAE